MNAKSKSPRVAQKDDGKRTRLLPFLIGGIIAVFILVLVIIEVVAAVLSSRGPYCASVDPTACTISVRISNDTSKTLTIKDCIGTGSSPCRSFDQIQELQPGKTYSTLGRTDKEPPQPWLVTDENGKILGCVNLQFTNNLASPVPVPLSKLVSCKPYL
jgi:hypothetical protein